MTPAPPYTRDPAEQNVLDCLNGQYVRVDWVAEDCGLDRLDMNIVLESLMQQDRITKRMRNGRREIRRKDTHDPT